MKMVLRWTVVGLAGFCLGALAVSFLSRRHTRIVLGQVLVRYELEQEVLAACAVRRSDWEGAARHYANLVDSVSRQSTAYVETLAQQQSIWSPFRTFASL